MRGGSPSSRQSTGLAIRSPSRSRSTMSATTIAGRRPCRDSTLRPRVIAPSFSRSLSSSFSAVRCSPLTPKARATSRLVTRPAGLTPLGAASPERNASSASREGRPPASVGCGCAGAVRRDFGKRDKFGGPGQSCDIGAMRPPDKSGLAFARSGLGRRLDPSQPAFRSKARSSLGQSAGKASIWLRNKGLWKRRAKTARGPRRQPPPRRTDRDRRAARAGARRARRRLRRHRHLAALCDRPDLLRPGRRRADARQRARRDLARDLDDHPHRRDQIRRAGAARGERGRGRRVRALWPAASRSRTQGAVRCCGR